ncbi:MAG TPA: UPF0182 family protein, partial [Longimicrobiales bacterium]|nr:UPF0182 family protein [Longimicrobiales bacterium]
DARARLPALRVLTLLTIFSAVLVFYGTWRNRLVPALSGVALVAVGGLVGGRLYPSLVQRFQVEPNELGRETPYIEYNLASTRTGFGLDVLQRDQMRYDSAAALLGGEARRQVEGLPVWSASTLLTTFREREARYPYYEFGGVDVDRYPVGGGSKVVAISVREVDPSGMDDPNWQNLHIRERYIAGMGAVVAAATERTAEGSPPMYLWSIPPQFAGGPDVPPGLWLTRPSVYVGSRPQRYAVINPRPVLDVGPGEGLDPTSSSGAPGGRRGADRVASGQDRERQPGVDFPRGIVLDSFLHTLALAWYERDPNLLFASEVTDSSHFVMRRQVRERVSAIAPFLLFPEEPYPVIYEGKIVWILEGFTATSGFPLSRHQSLGPGARASWVRNSVKVTVDALTGEVRFYALPEGDPLLEAYARAFPGLLTPLAGMPADLQAHLRYSRAYLNLQAQVLEQYHQNSAPVFHGQQDVWATPRELSRNTSPIPYRPEFGLYRLPGEDRASFHLTTVFVPRGRQNLTAFLAARLDEEGRRRLRLLDIPVADQAPGPRQVEALVEQDPTISQQFSLWRTGGSQVWTGHLHLVPVGERILYVEPIFLAAEADAIPELRRFVASDGRRVAMEPTLGATIGVLTGEAVAGEVEETEPSGAVDLGGEPSRWPAGALDLLDQAESRLKAGDWEGFGQALEALRRFLEAAGAGGGEGGGSASGPRG